MDANAEIEAAKERLEASQYDGVVVFTKRGDVLDLMRVIGGAK